MTLGIAFGLVALLSPLLSSTSDYSGNHKSYMQFFCYLGGLACVSLFFFTGPNLLLGIGGLLLATVGYSGSIVFYNSYLPAIATEDRQDRVSARGFAYGYVGATTLMLGILVLMFNPHWLGIAEEGFVPRLAFALTGLWWIAFAQFTFRRLPRGIYVKRPEGRYLWHGYRELVKIWRRLRSEPRLRTFLLAFFFYIMGVQTVMFMAASFGEKEVGLKIVQLIATVIALEYLAIAGAYLFAGLSERLGNVRALTLTVAVWVGITTAAYFIRTPFHFYSIAVFIGLVMGGIQALSRSTYAKLIPKTQNNAGYFSFFDVCEKVAILIGLVLFGYLDNLTGSMRNSILLLGIWFVLRLLLLLRLQRQRA
jgi:UMF1 family MFS transporter